MQRDTFWVSLAAFMHITFQPLMANWWFSQWVHPKSADNMALVYKLCGAFAVFWVARVLLMDESNRCTDSTHCSDSTFKMKRGCAHIQYLFPMRKSAPFIPSYFAFMFLWFIPVLFMQPMAKGVIAKAWLCMSVPLFMTLLLYYGILEACPSLSQEAASTWCILLVVTVMLHYLVLKTPKARSA